MELYTEGLGVAAELGDDAGVAYCLERIADLVPVEDQAARKARLYGASEAILETVGAPLYVQLHDRELYACTLEKVRTRLGEDAFEAAWSEGRTMTQEEAVEYALATPQTPDETETAYPAGLSSREVEVLRLVAKGMTNAQIAKGLFISPRTVNGHLTSTYHKTGASGRVEAARFATEHGLL